ncbi:tRNA 4-thiouridine(8) synthase ThiI [candidate division KSB1 bacterium]|nr:tRNA 4-thiouridine(8) synthase ThiI [candidate division KSB1 bacterium]
MENCFIIHYSEIGLKKGNRGFFEHKLKVNIVYALSDICIAQPHFDFGRILLPVDDVTHVPAITDRLANVIGIAHYSVASQGDPDVEVLKEQVFDRMKHLRFDSFRIETRRADKTYPLNSMEVNRIVGARIHLGLGKKVVLDSPDVTCNIEIFNKKLFFSCERRNGYGGLPVGSSGKVVSLLSSGIDSPVASFRMMTRGCRVIFVHFHSFPFTEKSSYYNAVELARKLTVFQYRSKIYLVPLAPIQQEVILHAPAKLRLILYRRMMIRLAERIARRERAGALVTGDSVGQVASQTIENLAAISQVAGMPILRPLVGMDKEFIVRQAKELGTFNTSTEPYDDCCSYLVPRNPETKAKLDQVFAAEAGIKNMEDLLYNALKETEVETLEFPSHEGG